MGYVCVLVQFFFDIRECKMEQKSLQFKKGLYVGKFQ